MKKSFSINSLFYKNLKEIMAGRYDKFLSGDLIRNYIRLQLGCIPDSDPCGLENIWYGAENVETDGMIFDFWINQKNISLGEFWLENFETDWSYAWLMHKYHMTLPMAQATVRCISCILFGYQCRIDLTAVLPQWRKIWARNFNIYLHRRYQYIGSSDLWCEEIAAQRFCAQFPDTKYNREAISYFVYRYVPLLETYGLQLKSTNLLLSQLVLSYFDASIYPKVQIAKKYVGGTGLSLIHI